MTVVKEGANSNPLVVNIALLTYSQLEAQGIILPTELQGARPDPAECESKWHI